MTSTALELSYAAGALAIQPGQIQWDTTQLAALDQLGLKDAGDGDRAVFLHVCQRTGLDPFARQIYMIGRNEKVPGTRDEWRKKWTIQTGIDGFRVNRSRAEKEAGVRGILGRAIFYDPDGNEHKVWVQPRPPVACEITYTVRDRDGTETPYVSVLRFSEYCQTDKDGNLTAQWKTKQAHMLEKCTEADVYRKAFPQDFSAIYLDDTMPPQEDAPAAPPRGRVTAGEVIGRGPAETATSERAAGQEASRAPRTRRAAAKVPIDRPAGAPSAASSEGATPGSAAPATAPTAYSGADQSAPEDEPGSASQDQLTSLHIILGGLGFGGEDREAKLHLAETITGRAPLTGPHDGRSSKNLSFTEARKLTDTLDGFGGDREKLIEYMAAREQAGDGDE